VLAESTENVSTKTTVESVVVDVASVEELLEQDAKVKIPIAEKIKITFFICLLFLVRCIYLIKD